MAKTIGLTQTNKKYIEIHKFPQNIRHSAVLLYGQGISFYRIFRKSFGNGYKTIFGHDIPNMENLNACFTNFHFAVELLLKSLIYLKIDEQQKTHNLIDLLSTASQHYPNLLQIDQNIDYKLLLKELSDNFDTIRYCEGTICLSPNKKQSWKSKKPLEELSEIMHNIFIILDSTFQKETHQN